MKRNAHVSDNKQINVVVVGASALMQHDALIDDFYEFEQAYSPPFGEQLDPLHILAYAANSFLHNGVKILPPDDLSHIGNDSFIILDVRNDEEQPACPVPENAQTIAIPIENLREGFHTIPPDKHIVAICQKGPRAYEAFLALREQGFKKISFLGGGMLFARLQKVCNNRLLYLNCTDLSRCLHFRLIFYVIGRAQQGLFL